YYTPLYLHFSLHDALPILLLHLDRLLHVGGALLVGVLAILRDQEARIPAPGPELRLLGVHGDGLVQQIKALLVLARLDQDLGARSEEHTSELQSLAYLVCR